MLVGSHAGPVHGLALDPSSLTLFSGSSDCTLRSWNLISAGTGQGFRAAPACAQAPGSRCRGGCIVAIQRATPMSLHMGLQYEGHRDPRLTARSASASCNRSCNSGAGCCWVVDVLWHPPKPSSPPPFARLCWSQGGVVVTLNTCGPPESSGVKPSWRPQDLPVSAAVTAGTLPRHRADLSRLGLV